MLHDIAYRRTNRLQLAHRQLDARPAARLFHGHARLDGRRTAPELDSQAVRVRGVTLTSARINGPGGRLASGAGWAEQCLP